MAESGAVGRFGDLASPHFDISGSQHEQNPPQLVFRSNYRIPAGCSEPIVQSCRHHKRPRRPADDTGGD